jgi:hypothetical protein
VGSSKSKTPPLTLDEHRVQVLDNLKACMNPKQVCELLADVQMMLAGTGVSKATQAAFWRSISTELDLETQRSMLVLQEDPGKTLRNLIATARLTITRYQRLLADSDAPTRDDSTN